LVAIGVRQMWRRGVSILRRFMLLSFPHVSIPCHEAEVGVADSGPFDCAQDGCADFGLRINTVRDFGF
jgi:hypothetical protein